MTVDNWKAIREQSSYVPGDEYYLLEILQRKKDFPPEEQGDVKDHMVLATYFVDSLEKFDRIEEEVKMLCRLHNARAYWNPSRKSKKRTAFILMKECMDMMENNDYSKIESKLTSAAGQAGGIKDQRKFLLDVDTKDEETLDMVKSLIESVNPLCSFYIIPSVNGWHIISEPFDVQKWNDLGGKFLKNVEIKHNSPTVIYYEERN